MLYHFEENPSVNSKFFSSILDGAMNFFFASVFIPVFLSNPLHTVSVIWIELIFPLLILLPSLSAWKTKTACIETPSCRTPVTHQHRFAGPNNHKIQRQKKSIKTIWARPSLRDAWETTKPPVEQRLQCPEGSCLPHTQPPTCWGAGSMPCELFPWWCCVLSDPLARGSDPKRIWNLFALSLVQTLVAQEKRSRHANFLYLQGRKHGVCPVEKRHLTLKERRKRLESCQENEERSNPDRFGQKQLYSQGICGWSDPTVQRCLQRQKPAVQFPCMGKSRISKNLVTERRQITITSLIRRRARCILLMTTGQWEKKIPLHLKGTVA